MLDLLGSFNISVSGIISGLIFGTIGWWMFLQGRRNADNRIVVIGLLLMMYPYFTSGPWGDWGIGTLLCGVAYYYW